MQPWLRERNPCVLHCLRPSSLLKQCVRSREHSGAHTHGPIEDGSKPRPAHLLAVHQVRLPTFRWTTSSIPGLLMQLCHLTMRVSHFICACTLSRGITTCRGMLVCAKEGGGGDAVALPSCAQLIGRDAGRATCPAFCTLAGAPSVLHSVDGARDRARRQRVLVGGVSLLGRKILERKGFERF